MKTHIQTTCVLLISGIIHPLYSTTNKPYYAYNRSTDQSIKLQQSQSDIISFLIPLFVGWVSPLFLQNGFWFVNNQWNVYTAAPFETQTKHTQWIMLSVQRKNTYWTPEESKCSKTNHKKSHIKFVLLFFVFWNTPKKHTLTTTHTWRDIKY